MEFQLLFHGSNLVWGKWNHLIWQTILKLKSKPQKIITKFKQIADDDKKCKQTNLDLSEEHVINGLIRWLLYLMEEKSMPHEYHDLFEPKICKQTADKM